MNVARLLATKGMNVVTIQPNQSIREAIDLLTRHNIGALVVVEGGGKPIGIISERDIVRELARNEEPFSDPVSSIMTRHIITGMPQDDLKTVANTMTEKRIRHIPLVDQGKLVGIISIGDVVRAQRDQYQGEIETLHTQILGDAA
jgi:CBS domain-containing protein